MNWVGNNQLQVAAKTLVELGLREDLGLHSDEPVSTNFDLTSRNLIASDEVGAVLIVARDRGVIAGLGVGSLVYSVLDPSVTWTSDSADGDSVQPGEIIAQVSGSLRSLLVGERTCLNFLSHLSGIASLTNKMRQAAGRSDLAVLDTRKTIPGYRRLQKYAVACGGGTNHRMGLFDGVLIKDNHLAAWNRRTGSQTIGSAIREARSRVPAGTQIEVEVDRLDQLKEALATKVDIILLDNMTLAELKSAVELRNQMAPNTKLEASGNIKVETISEIAKTGVDRVSIGGLTHSAPALDIGFDWER